MDLKLVRLAFVVTVLIISSGTPFSKVPAVEGRICRSNADCPPCANGPSVCDLGICFCLRGGLAPPALILPKFP
ncbi:hypothetical protein QQP08_009712 [Theobroma cacao]|nr:hypothetical protein QQP08_009712 [Theobroma cacao]